MKVEIEIQTKPERDALGRKGDSSEAIFDLKEVQAIKYAIQEHFLFIGLDRNNNITNIRLIGVGNSSGINIDSKDIVRTALLTASEKVVLAVEVKNGQKDETVNITYTANEQSGIISYQDEAGKEISTTPHRLGTTSLITYSITISVFRTWIKSWPQ